MAFVRISLTGAESATRKQRWEEATSVVVSLHHECHGSSDVFAVNRCLSTFRALEVMTSCLCWEMEFARDGGAIPDSQPVAELPWVGFAASRTCL